MLRYEFLLILLIIPQSLNTNSPDRDSDLITNS